MLLLKKKFNTHYRCSACEIFFALPKNVLCATCNSHALEERMELTQKIISFEEKFKAPFRRTDDVVYDEYIKTDEISDDDILEEDEIEASVEYDGALFYKNIKSGTDTNDYVNDLDMPSIRNLKVSDNGWFWKRD